MRSPYTICLILLCTVWVGFLGIAGLWLCINLIAVYGRVWLADAAMFLTLLLPVIVLLSLGGIVLAVWSAFREKAPRAWLAAVGFLPPCIISALAFTWVLYAGSHF